MLSIKKKVFTLFKLKSRTIRVVCVCFKYFTKVYVFNEKCLRIIHRFVYLEMCLYPKRIIIYSA